MIKPYYINKKPVKRKIRKVNALHDLKTVNQFSNDIDANVCADLYNNFNDAFVNCVKSLNQSITWENGSFTNVNDLHVMVEYSEWYISQVLAEDGQPDVKKDERAPSYIKSLIELMRTTPEYLSDKEYSALTYGIRDAYLYYDIIPPEQGSENNGETPVPEQDVTRWFVQTSRAHINEGAYFPAEQNLTLALSHAQKQLRLQLDTQYTTELKNSAVKNLAEKREEPATSVK